MDFEQGKVSLEPRKRQWECSPVADSEAELMEKKFKLATPPVSPSGDWTLSTGNDMTGDVNGHEGEDSSCFDVLVGAPESPIRETPEQSQRKSDVFNVTRSDYPSSQTCVSRPKFYLPLEFTSQIERRSLKNCPLKYIYHNEKRMKHEDFVIKIFRGYLKGIQWVIGQKQRPTKGIFSVLLKNNAAVNMWEEFALQVLQYLSSVKDSIAPENLPATDKKSKADPDRPFRSYNKSFVAYFFQKNGYLIILYSYFCKIVFQASPEVLCKAWKMDCKKERTHRHDGQCEKRWEDLRKYAQKKMLEELGINAYDE